MPSANDNLLQDRERDLSGTQKAALERVSTSRPLRGAEALAADFLEDPAFVWQRLQQQEVLDLGNRGSTIPGSRAGRTQQTWYSERSAQPFSYRVSATAKMMERLAKAWNLSDLEIARMLGFTSAEVWNQIVAGNQPMEMSLDRKDRMATILKIHSILAGLYRNEDASNRWLRTTIGDLDGSPLALMTSGAMRALYAVHDYLQGIVDSRPDVESKLVTEAQP